MERKQISDLRGDAREQYGSAHHEKALSTGWAHVPLRREITVLGTITAGFTASFAAGSGFTPLGAILAMALSPVIFLAVRSCWHILSVSATRRAGSAPTAPKDSQDAPRGPVAILWATRNEPREVLEFVTLRSLLGLQWRGPLHIVVADNSDPSHPGWRQWQEHLRSVDRETPANVTIHFLHRPSPDADTPEHRVRRLRGFKGGNLDAAVEFCRRNIAPDYYVLVDTDSTLPADALIRGAAQLDGRPDVGFVQFRTRPENGACNRLSRTAARLLGVQRLTLGERGRESFLCFYGHNAMFTAGAMDLIESWVDWLRPSEWGWLPSAVRRRLRNREQEVLTEDLAVSVELYRQELRGVPSEDVVAGEWVPFKLRDWRSMWLRWTYGTLQVLACKPRAMLGTALPARHRYGVLCHVAEYGVNATIPVAALLGALIADGTVALAASIWLLGSLGASIATAYSAHRLALEPKGSGLRSALHIMALQTLTCWITAEATVYFARLRSRGWSSPTGKGTDGQQLSWREGLAGFGGLILFAAVLLGGLAWQSASLLEAVTLRLGPLLFALLSLLGLFAFGRCQRRGRPTVCSGCDLSLRCPAARLV